MSETTYAAASEAHARAVVAWNVKTAARRVELAHIDEGVRESQIITEFSDDYEQLAALRIAAQRFADEMTERALEAQELTAEAHMLAATDGRLRAGYGLTEGARDALEAGSKPPVTGQGEET